MEGNQMKMREALVKIRRELNSYCTCLRDSFLEIERIVAAALAAPSRQCDVGTAEEQVVRFRDAMVHECLADEYCRCKDAARCFAQWTQLPYDAKEGAGK